MRPFAYVMAVTLSVLAMGLGPTAANAEPAPATDQVLRAPLDSFVAAFNRWDLRLPDRSFAEDCVVVDIFPPFVWSGAGAAQRWWGLLAGTDEASHRRKAALRQHLEVGAIEALTTRGDQAQFNVPATLTYVSAGASHTIHGRWIIAERRTPAGWRISAHAWATIDQD